MKSLWCVLPLLGLSLTFIVQASSAGLSDQIKMHTAEIRDVNMNNVVAYTMLVPDGWDFQGHVEWSQDKTPYPQKIIKISGPDESGLAFSPASSFAYTRMRFVGGGGTTVGVPPPTNLGAWVVRAVGQRHPECVGIRLLSDERDPAAEQEKVNLIRQTGVPNHARWEVHKIRFTYSLHGVPFLEEARITYSVNEPSRTQWNESIGWMLFVDSDVRAPRAKFEAMRPILYATANSLRTVPKWFTQQQIVLMEITQRNFINGMEEIRRRGEYYDRLSDANMAAWRKSQVISDRQQNARINTIYEVDDFRDTNGLPVKLPIHYKNYYSDGRGNYVMTNNSSDDPGSDWTRLEPMN